MINTHDIAEFRKELLKQSASGLDSTETFLRLNGEQQSKVLPFVQKKATAAYNNVALFVAPTCDEAA